MRRVRVIFFLGRSEWPLLAGVITAALFLVFGEHWLAGLSNPAWFGFILVWVFSAVLIAAFAVVRHAEGLAVRLGEPLGTIVLTLAVTGIEVMMISAVMYAGHGNATLARDTVFAAVMIVLNGLVGLCLLLGGLRYREQIYNLYGANAFLAVIVPLAVLGLVLPSFTAASLERTLSAFQSGFFIVMAVGLYGVFLAIQTLGHREYFIEQGAADTQDNHSDAASHDGPEVRSGGYHALFLVAYLLTVILLAEQLAVPIDHGVSILGAPPALGGLLVAVLVLSPECLAAVRAALANRLQRAINLALGGVLAVSSLTIPAVLTIGLITDQTIILGLDAVDTTLLLLTLVVSMLTFALERTNVLLGAVHLLLFLAYLMLIFDN